MIENEKRRKILQEDLPDMSHYSQEMRQVVVGSYLSSLGRYRSKDDVMLTFKVVEALYSVLEAPRPCHFKYILGLTPAELWNRESVRRKLCHWIDGREDFIKNRETVFGHLWEEIASFIDDEVTAERLATAYPSLIPKVRAYYFTSYSTLLIINSTM